MSVFATLIHCQKNDELDTAFQLAVHSLKVDQLNLQQAVKNGSVVLEDGFQAMLLASEHTEQQLIIKAGIFFHSIIAGCNCADDPGAVDTLEEYTEAWFVIDKQDGSFKIKFV